MYLDHERALLRLASPMGGVRPGQVARRLWVHHAVMLLENSPIRKDVTVLFVHQIFVTFQYLYALSSVTVVPNALVCTFVNGSPRPRFSPWRQ